MIKSCIHPAHCRCHRCLPKHPAARQPFASIAVFAVGVVSLGAVIAAMRTWSGM